MCAIYNVFQRELIINQYIYNQYLENISDHLALASLPQGVSRDILAKSPQKVHKDSIQLAFLLDM